MAFVEQQAAFLLDMCKLIPFGADKGFIVTVGELERKPEMQEIYVRTGRSKTMNGNHLKRCAIDLNFFKKTPASGALELTYDIRILKPIGDFCESLSSQNSWAAIGIHSWTCRILSDGFSRLTFDRVIMKQLFVLPLTLALTCAWSQQAAPVVAPEKDAVTATASPPKEDAEDKTVADSMPKATDKTKAIAANSDFIGFLLSLPNTDEDKKLILKQQTAKQTAVSKAYNNPSDFNTLVARRSARTACGVAFGVVNRRIRSNETWDFGLGLLSALSTGTAMATQVIRSARIGAAVAASSTAYKDYNSKETDGATDHLKSIREKLMAALDSATNELDEALRSDPKTVGIKQHLFCKFRSVF